MSQSNEAARESWGRWIIAIIAVILSLLMLSEGQATPVTELPVPGEYVATEHEVDGRVRIGAQIKDETIKAPLYVLDSTPRKYVWYDTQSLISVAGTDLQLQCYGTEWTGQFWVNPPGIEVNAKNGSFTHRVKLTRKGPLNQALPLPSSRKVYMKDPAKGCRVAGQAGASAPVAIRLASTLQGPASPLRVVDGILWLSANRESSLSEDERNRNSRTWQCLMTEGHPALEFREQSSPGTDPMRVLVKLDGTFLVEVRLGAMYEWSIILPEFCGGPEAVQGPPFRAGSETDAPVEIAKIAIFCRVVEHGFTHCLAQYQRRP